jgi:hypothetical protein
MIQSVESTSYADAIAALAAVSLPARIGQTLTPLLTDLGCLYFDTIEGTAVAVQPCQPSDVAEPLVRDTLLRSLRSYIVLAASDPLEGLYLLDGLLRKQRWTACLETSEDAYFFADLLLRVSGVICANPGEASDAYLDAIRTNVCDALNMWFRPTLPFTDLPDPAVLVRSMFGDAWCDLVIGLPDEEIIQIDIRPFILSTTPGFATHMLKFKQETAFPLPTLETPC